MASQNWDLLTAEKQRTLVETMPSDALAAQFGMAIAFFDKVKGFYGALPKQTVQPARKKHEPPKDLVVSARRDLSFYEANFELFDNAIDHWRRSGAAADLLIEVDYNMEQRTGVYKDNAGGMAGEDVYKVFIP